MSVALDGIVFDEEFDALVETGTVEGDGIAQGDLGRISRCQTHQVIHARRV